MGSDCLASWLAKAFAGWWLTTMAFGAALSGRSRLRL